MRTFRLRIVVLVVAQIAAMTWASPSFAAATTVTLSTSGTGYNVTGARNTIWDWNMAPQEGWRNGVSVSVPPGTDSVNPKYYQMGKMPQNYASTPDSTQNSLTGDLDIRVKFNQQSTGAQTLLAKYDNTDRAYRLDMSNNYITLFWTSDGTSSTERAVSRAIGWVQNSDVWVRATLRQDSGAGLSRVSFYTSSDGNTWFGVGGEQTVTLTAIKDTVSPLRIGSVFADTQPFSGNIYFASVGGVIQPTNSSSTCTTPGVVNCFDPTTFGAGQTSLASASPTHETWSFTQGTDMVPADIASNVSVTSSASIPTAAATLRYLSGRVVQMQSSNYYLTTVPTRFSVGGLVNPSAPVSFASTLRWYYGSSYWEEVTAPAFSFIDAGGGVAVAVAVDPSMSFSVAGYSSSCNGVTPNGTSSANGISFGRVNVGTSRSAAQLITVSTNAASGALVQLQGTSTLAGSGSNIPSTPGSFASPAALPALGTAAFGVTVGGASAFAGPLWAAVPATPTAVLDAPSAFAGSSTCVAYSAQVGSTTPAGDYSGQVRYLAVARF